MCISLEEIVSSAFPIVQIAYLTKKENESMDSSATEFHMRPINFIGKKIDVTKLDGYDYRFYPVGDELLPMLKIIVAEGYDRNYGCII